MEQVIPKSRRQRIRVQPSWGRAYIQLGGWLDGKQTYLRIADTNDRMLGGIEGRSLYRLAKAIVRRFEEPGGEGG